MIDGDVTRARHLLLVPDDVTPDEVDALVVSRFGTAAVPTGGCQHWQLNSEVSIDGPLAPDPTMPEWVNAAYAVETPKVRGGAVPAALRGRGGLLDAFAEGEPGGVERELLEFALAAARRLGGGVRTDSAAILVPQPRPDLIVYSPVWLHPDALLHVLEPHFPTMSLHLETGNLTALAATGDSLLDADQRSRLHADSAAFDEAALAEPAVSESYGAAATDPDGTVWSVVVEAAAVLPPTVAELAVEGTIVYEVRCYPGDVGMPADAVARIDAAVAAVLAAAGGSVVDDDGFLVTI